jgi:TolB protein
MMSDPRSLLEGESRRFIQPDGAFERLVRRRDRKRRNQRIAAGVVGITVFVAAVWIVTSGGSLNRTETPAVPGGATGPKVSNPTAKSAVGPVPETDYLLDLDNGETTALPTSIAGAGYAASPDGSRLAYTGPGDDGTNQIFVANLDGTGIEQVTHGFGAAYSPVWSPDGSKIAYSAGGTSGDDLRDLFVVDLATGESTQLTFGTLEPDPAAPDLSPWKANLPSFTPDGAFIVYNADRGSEAGDEGEFELRMVPVAGGESEVLIRDQFSGVRAIDEARLSPDGSLVSYSCGRFGSICVANPDGTDERVLVQWQGDALGGGGWSPDGTRFAYAAFHQYDVSIVDVATGEATYVAEGWGPTWLDDHTLIVEMPRCYNPVTGRLATGGAMYPGCTKA